MNASPSDWYGFPHPIFLYSSVRVVVKIVIPKRMYFNAVKYTNEYNHWWKNYSNLCLEVNKYFIENPKTQAYNIRLVNLIKALVATNERLVAMLSGILVLKADERMQIIETISDNCDDEIKLSKEILDLLNKHNLNSRPFKQTQLKKKSEISQEIVTVEPAGQLSADKLEVIFNFIKQKNKKNTQNQSQEVEVFPHPIFIASKFDVPIDEINFYLSHTPAKMYYNFWKNYCNTCKEIELYFFKNPKAQVYNPMLVKLLTELVDTNEKLIALLWTGIVNTVNENEWYYSILEKDRNRHRAMYECLDHLETCPSI